MWYVFRLDLVYSLQEGLATLLITLHTYMYGRLGSDLTIIASSSHSFVVFDFSFDVLSQDCMSNFGQPL